MKKELTDASGNSRKTWGIINGVLNRSQALNICDNKKFIVNNNEINDSSEIANEFNRFFVNIGAEQIDNNILNHNYRTYLNDVGDTVVNFEFIDANEDELLNIMSGFRSSAAGVDELPMSLIKRNLNLLKIPLLFICNTSMRTGIFPSELKIAKVKPLHKKDNKCHIENYRPISILPVFSKVIERLVCNRLVAHLEDNSLLTDSQHGYRQGRSTTSAVLSLNDRVIRSFERYEHSVAVFLDFTKAFNMVDHSILLDKLKYIGV